MGKSIEEHAAELTESLLQFAKMAPDDANFPAITRKIHTSRELLLRALLEEDVDWDTNPASPLAQYTSLMERADEAHNKADDIANQKIPQAKKEEKKEIRRRTVRVIDTKRTFASARDFLRAAENMNGISTIYFTGEGAPKYNTPFMLDLIANFCSVYLSISRDEIAALPGSDMDRRRALAWYDRYRPVAENIRDAEDSDTWLRIIYATPGNPDMLKKWDIDEEGTDDEHVKQ